MKTLNGQELQIFRAGNYGPKGTYTPADLQQIASDYDPTKHEAPLCIGHPTTNAPAFGWLKSVRADGDLLFGTFEKVPPAMDRLVDQGAYKKRSIAFRTLPGGKLQVRHVGYLGAMDPHIQGLADAQFADEQFQEIEFSGTGDDVDDQQIKKTIMDSVKEFFDGLSGRATQATAISATPEQLTALEDRLTAKFSADLKVEADKRIAAENALTAHTKEFAAGNTQARINRVIDGLKARKHWLPAYDHMQVPALFAALGASSTVEIEFSSEQDGKTVTAKLDPIAALERFLDGYGKLVPEGHQFDSSKVVVDGQTQTVETGGGTAVNAGSVAFNQEIQARMKADSVSYPEAYQRLTREGKSAATYATASAGQA